MIRKLVLALTALSAVVPAHAAESIFKGSEISLTEDFVCGEKTRRSGRYGLQVFYDEAAGASKLAVSKGDETLCEIAGEKTENASTLAASKVRVITRVDSEKKAIQIDVVTPSGVRSRIPNQVFYLPLADKN